MARATRTFQDTGRQLRQLESYIKQYAELALLNKNNPKQLSELLFRLSSANKMLHIPESDLAQFKTDKQ